MKKHSKESRRLSCMVIGVLAGILPISLLCNAFMWPSSSPPERKDGCIHPVQDTQRNILLLTRSQDSRVEKALSLDNQFHLQTNIPFNSSILATNETDVVVVCNYHLSPAEAGNLSEFMEAGGNILFMFGPDSIGEENLFQGIGMEITSSQNHDNIGINYTTGQQDHPIVKKVQWSSAPSIWNRSVVGGVNGSF
ncbi:hypothetical protein GF325_16565, partial [Candidatus Bathyarchaeota archaeon]|nr:hypothetical protein [Candidatus Bathyarchaeota archaeon]